MDNNAPLVSVIIPCYNVAGFVDKSIQSILQQTYSNLEIWIIDDASTDNTLQKIRAFDDKRIRIAEFKKNSKKVGAVNEVLLQTQGDYIVFQDADDWSEPTRIEKELDEFLKNPDLGICFTSYKYVAKKITEPGKIALTNEELQNEFLNYTYKKKPATSPTICATMMISKLVLENTGGYHPYFAGRVGEDIQWIYRILKTYKGITLNEALYNYTIRQGSLTQISVSGKNAKYAYSWQLLSKIIYKDVHEGIDLLAPSHADLLRKIELEACEDALVEKITLLNETRLLYENSTSFKLGKLILSPWRLLKSKKNK